MSQKEPGNGALIYKRLTPLFENDTEQNNNEADTTKNKIKDDTGDELMGSTDGSTDSAADDRTSGQTGGEKGVETCSSVADEACFETTDAIAGVSARAFSSSAPSEIGGTTTVSVTGGAYGDAAVIVSPTKPKTRNAVVELVTEASLLR